MSEATQDARRLLRNYLEFQVNLGYEEILFLPRQDRLSGCTLLEAIRADLGDCKRCPLHKARRHIVFGEGPGSARLMFVGEGPGAEEDHEGRPFVGAAGRLLSRMIAAMGLERSQVYIANVVKCRPPNNRDPETIEIGTCLPFLQEQIKAVAPEVIVTLGRIAARAILGNEGPLSGVRGKFHYRDGIPVMPTYHPSYLLRQESDRRYKAEAWADLKLVMARMVQPISNSGGKS